MGKQSRYKHITRELRAELNRFFGAIPNLTEEKKEEIFQHARKKAIKELSFKKKPM